MIPNPRYKIRKDDQVMVVSGKEKGKTGRVMRVIPNRGTVVLEKLNMVKRHTKPSSKHRHGGIIEKEAPIAVSNVMIICDKCNKPVRVGKKLLEDGRRARCCRKCGEVLDK
ncbi:MAG: 50S ribosomal protein L24 [Thermodesulfobacteriota bacterium]